VTLSNIVSTSDSNGVISAVATPISATQPVEVDLQAQGAIPTVFGNAAVTLQGGFNIAVSGGGNGGGNGNGNGGGSTTPGQGSPAGLRILSGNNQTGPVGQVLPSPLTARVEDVNGNPLSNVTVTWQPSSSVMLTNIVST